MKLTKMDVEQARMQAQKFLREVASGLDSNLEQKEDVFSVTHSEVSELYLKVRYGLIEPMVRDYRWIMKEIFEDWQGLELRNITKDMIQRRHQENGKRTQVRAINAMQLLTIIFNFVRCKYENN